jgi:hypothetical protein
MFGGRVGSLAFAPPWNAGTVRKDPFNFRVRDQPSSANVHGTDMAAIDQPADCEVAHSEKLRDFAYSS